MTELAGKSFPFVEALCGTAPRSTPFRAHDVDAVIHFAGLKAVGESVAKPLALPDEPRRTLSLLAAMAEPA